VCPQRLCVRDGLTHLSTRAPRVHAQHRDFERPEVAAVRPQRPLDERHLLVPGAAPVGAECGVVPGLDRRSGEYRRADTTLEA
jgi:hypothetical protein